MRNAHRVVGLGAVLFLSAGPAWAGKGGVKGSNHDSPGNGNGNAYGHCDDSDDDHDRGIGNDEGGPHAACEEVVVCPCFDADDLDGYFAGFGAGDTLYASSWAVRSPTTYGTTEEYGIYGAPASGTVGPLAGYPTDVWSLLYTVADVYRVTAEGGQAYCSMWSESWVGSGYGEWGGDFVGVDQALTDDEYDACLGHLSDWTTDAGLPLYSY